jgi:hypothetical protein
MNAGRSATILVIARTRAIRHSSTSAPLAGISGSHWRIPKIIDCLPSR